MIFRKVSFSRIKLIYLLLQHIERSLGEQILKERDQILEKSEINEYNTHNTTQHNTTQHNTTQHNTTQHNTT